MSEHITDEFKGADLKDRRLQKRLLKVVADLAEAPAASISAACGGWAEIAGAFRLLNSDKVTPDALLGPHRDAVICRCAEHPCLIVSQDTTELDFTRMEATEGLGPLNSEKRRGFFMHSLHVGSEQGLPLGILDAAIHIRDDEHFRINAKRKKRPIEEKESYRWLVGYRKTCELARALPADCEVFSVSDREGDIHEVFEAWREAVEAGDPVAHWLIRANQDRALINVEGTDPVRLFAALEAAPALGQIEFEISAKMSRVTKKKGSPW